MKGAVYTFVAILGLGLAGEWGWLDLPFVSPSRSLARLVTRQQARELKEFYGALAIVVGSTDAITSTSDFRNTQILAVKIMQEQLPDTLDGLAKINKPINDRLTAAIGVDGEIPDAPLTAEMRVKLQKALDKISEDL